MRGEEQFLERIQKFINIHRNSFLVLSAALHGPQEWNIMFRIQRRYDFDIKPIFLLLGRNEITVYSAVLNSDEFYFPLAKKKKKCLLMENEKNAE